MATTSTLRDHIATAILDAAALVLSAKGDTASMEDVASAAGVGRATIYRYFPSRDDLLSALADVAIEDAHRRIVEADLERATVPEALARIVRAVVACGIKFSVVTSDHSQVDRIRVDSLIRDPIRAVFQRGQDEGVMRTDVTADLLVDLFGGLTKVALQIADGDELGAEEASAVITSIFLDGARPVGDAPAQAHPLPSST
ncbi:MAG TPA: TetR/AcrR family transcriptional regulator [Acidimicrobiales bacterium]|jgi:TetR/AcrR family transcriptional repressor of mexCD-oprJ operon|nr:TetR/AcrR family transcriptional regulator [Acidimicrobiales bacterium]